MPCLAPGLARGENMPVRHLSNDNPVDRIPNACQPPALTTLLTNEKKLICCDCRNARNGWLPFESRNAGK
jgi:hypothetical protein